MSYLKDREIWLSSVPTGNPPAGYVWVFIQNGVFVVRDSNGVDKIMASTAGSITTAATASYVQYSNVANKPTLVSGSAQITYSGVSGKPEGIVSSSVQVKGYNVFATTGSNQFNGSQAITGSLTVTGQVVAQTLNVQQVTSSIVYSSGSNIFGNNSGNTHRFTGSVSMTGSLAVAGALSGTSGTFSSNLLANTRVLINSSDATKTPLLLNAEGNYSTSGNMTAGFAITNTSFGRALNMGIFESGAYGWIQAAYINNADTTFALALQPRGGNVGIGTANPQALLTVSGANQALGGAFNTYGNVLITSNEGPAINRGGSLSLGGRYWTENTTIATFGRIHGKKEDTSDGSTAGYLSFETTVDATATLSEKMRINSVGNVGIGTTSPSSRLSIAGAKTNSADLTNAANQLTVTDTTATAAGVGGRISFLGAYTSTPDYFPFGAIEVLKDNANNYGSASWNNAAMRFIVGNNDNDANAGRMLERMRITSGGSLQMNYNPGGGDIYFRDTTNGAVMFYIIPATYVGTAPFNSNIFLAANSSHISFETGGAERMRITSDNNVLFNTTSTGTTNTSSFIFRSGTGAFSGVMVMNHATTNNTGAGFIDCFYNTGYIGGIQQNGASNVSFSTSSDYRLKQDLKDFNGLNLISNLKVYDFKWKTEDSRMYGLLAHELQEVIPYTVSGNKDEIKENGKIKVQVVDYSKLVPVLVKAIQELKSENDNLKSRLEVLEQS
jgi:hypothetical protein